MEENDRIVKWIQLLKSKTFEELEERSKFMGEKLSKEFVAEVKRLSNDEHILEQYSEDLYQRAVRNGCYEEDINKKIKEKQRKLVLKLLKEGYRVDKICNMLELTYSQIEAIVNGEDF